MTYVLVFTGLLVVLFLRPPFKLMVGGAPLSKDRRILYMVVVLTVFFSLVAHGVSANPLAKSLGQKEGTKEAGATRV